MLNGDIELASLYCAYFLKTHELYILGTNSSGWAGDCVSGARFKFLYMYFTHIYIYKPCELYNYPIDIAQIQSNHFHQCIIPHTLLYKLKGCITISWNLQSH